MKRFWAKLGLVLFSDLLHFFFCEQTAHHYIHVSYKDVSTILNKSSIKKKTGLNNEINAMTTEITNDRMVTKKKKQTEWWQLSVVS